MPSVFFQRKTIASSQTKEKKEKNSQKQSFVDNRSNANEISELQNSINDTTNSNEINQLQEKVDNTTGMPDDLKQGIESISGEDMSDVKVTHNSDKPAQLNAHAYASGNDIHVAPGQEKHLPHEAWHVVQQKQNRVKPTKKADSGELINEDPALEKEADVMGEKALQLKSTKQSELNSNSSQNGIIQKSNDATGTQGERGTTSETENTGAKIIDEKNENKDKDKDKENHIKDIMQNVNFDPDKHIALTFATKEYADFVKRFEKMKSDTGLGTISGNEINEIWKKTISVIHKTQRTVIEGEWRGDNETKENLMMAQTDEKGKKDLAEKYGKGFFAHNYAGTAYLEVMSEFEPLANMLNAKFGEVFGKTSRFGFWSKDPAKDTGKGSGAMMLESSPLGSLFDNLNFSGNWNMELWASMSKHYAIGIRNKIQEVGGDKLSLWGFIGPGGESDSKNIYALVESKELVNIDGSKEKFDFKPLIKWYACAPEINVNKNPNGSQGKLDDGFVYSKEQVTMHEPSSEHNVDGIKGAAKVSSDRQAIAEFATEVFKRRVNNAQQGVASTQV